MGHAHWGDSNRDLIDSNDSTWSYYVIYAVRECDTVFVTSNAGQGDGATWNQVTRKNQPGGIRAVTVDPINYRTAYLACNSGVHKTTDMGTTWTQQGVPNLIYNDV